MIQALAPDRADEPFREGILPRAVRRRQHLFDPHGLQAVPKSLTVGAIAVAEEIGRPGLVREGVDELLSGPGGGGMLGKNEEDAQTRGEDREEVERDQFSDIVGEERPPGLGRRGAPLRGQAGNDALGRVESELQEFAMDARRAGQRVEARGCSGSSRRK